MSDTPDAVMLFAAGFGTRMGALTANRPKPLITVAGKALLDHALDLAEGAKASRVVVNAHYRADQIASHLAGRPVAISRESPDILDTGGGLRAALGLLQSSVIHTLNTDAVWRGPNPLTLLSAAWRPDAMDALLLCLPPAQAIGHAGKGDFALAEDGALTRGGGLIYSGAQIIKASALDGMPEGAFSLNSVWDRLLPKGRLHGCIYPGKWCDVGHPGGISLAEDMLDAPDV
ncbi:nucleotidyltransferase [Pelagivirga sediminicola]|uniref:Nucleotidyltransferase n=1 Tax=Pelagivirga sediminicola TaxID=2170575 RepID=A0A2T7G8L6_9RHOB|nr:nucleotidyltransferase family protein [Pelagivirga sediminicola]PVA10762.1 nucleotidyltransferase [Pelagivirga sediminicola]